ncbi:hypothetical protein ABZ949_02130 [Micromonospora tulbaghiae]|uniref:hypothetical protein n=1 Tax=Micromonospora tulbaghiae TaxID=479978 RepID=UPI0033F45117
MTPAGRPEIGNPIHVRVGDLLPAIDAYRANHGLRKRQRPDAIRDLIRRGLEAAGGERILSNTDIPSIYNPSNDDDIPTLTRYLEAINAGTVLRHSGSPATEVYIRVVEYTDPLDGSTRYAVHFAGSYHQLDDYTDRKVAEAEYEIEVRGLADSDWLFASTDVEGVPTRESNQIPDDYL